MEKLRYNRKKKEDRPVLAICYDFDKTLSPNDMQAQGFIQSVGWDVEKFWTETNELAEVHCMDQNLAYMLRMLKEAEGRVLFTKENLAEYGSKLELFPGVEEWFDRINEYGRQHGVIVEHYIISSGLTEMIEGTSVAKRGAFERIYANSFYYNEKGVAVWPAQIVNYTNKTQFLFRIEKGVLDVNDPAVNDSFSPEEIRVPFGNMIYIGDSDTDVPCMKLVNINGGYSIGVYNAVTEDKTKVYKMMREGRIKYYVPADYSEGQKIDSLVKSIIVQTAEKFEIESAYFACKKETEQFDREKSEEWKRKIDFLNALDNSRTFATTHTVIANLNQFKTWAPEEKETLFSIAVRNSQVWCILKDKDVKRFYADLLSGAEALNENALAVKAEIEKAE